jgi:predicted nuclease with TOPRIM domain
MSLRRCAPFFLWTADPANPGGGGSSASAEGGESEKAKGGLEAAVVAERTKRQELERKLADLEKAQDEAARKKAEEQGEFERLYKETQPRLSEYEARLKDFEKRESKRLDALKTQNKARLEGLPEDWRELVPAGLDPEAQSEFLAKLEKKLSADPGPHGGVITKTPKKVEETIPPECIKEAAKHGRDPADWYRLVWKTREARKAAKAKN